MSDIDASNIPIDSEGDIDLQIDLDLCSDVLEDINVIPTEESYDYNMVAEQSEEEEDPGSPEAQRRKRKKEFWRQMKQIMSRMMREKRSVSPEKPKRLSLEEEHFRRMDKFGGDVS
eukprot:9696562-Karenia_brevis.AAC.1